jgi:hypothetical protein
MENPTFNIKKFLKTFSIERSFIFMLALALIAIVGLCGFWYYRNQVFSAEVLHLGIEGPQVAHAGDEVTYKVVYKNNGKFTLQKPKIAFDLPDYSLNEDGKTRFAKDVDDLKPGQQGALEFKARLVGKQDDVRVAKAYFSYIPQNLSVRYESNAKFSTKIDSTPIDLDYDMPSSLTRGNQTIYSVAYTSHIDYPLEHLSVKLDPVKGFKILSSNPSSLDNVEWKLSTLQKGQGGKISITGTIDSDSPDSLSFSAHLGMWQDGIFVVMKEVNVSVNASGVAQAPVPDAPKVADTHLKITQRAYYKDNEHFENYGPVPPLVGAATTYTVIWQVSNDLNVVKNARVTASLPTNVTLSALLPEGEFNHFSLDPASKKVSWSIASIPAKGTATLYIQLTLTPDASQSGNLANIIGPATVLGQDQATMHTVSSIAPALNSDLPDDSINSGGGIVK